MNGHAVIDSRGASESRLAEMPLDMAITSSHVNENEPQQPDPAPATESVDGAVVPLTSLKKALTASSTAAEQFALRQQLLHEYGGAHKVAMDGSVTRKRANSVDAGASRPDDNKRLRTHAASTRKPTSINTDDPKLPAFPLQGTDREIALIVDDDEMVDYDDIRTWFDYDGPKKGRQETAMNSDPKTKDAAQKPRASKGVNDEKSEQDADEPAPGLAAKKTGGRKRSKSKRTRKPKPTPKPKPAESDKDSEDCDFESENTTPEDSESEPDGDHEGPWQGPINLEPFDGGFGLPDEEEMEEDIALLHDQIFPSGGACTDGFWQRRVRVSFTYNVRYGLANDICRARTSRSSPTAKSQRTQSHLGRRPSKTLRSSRS